MTYFVDANALIWSQDSPENLGVSAKNALTDLSNELLIGKGTLWEIGIKVSTGKLQLSKPLNDWLDFAIRDLKLIVAEIELAHIVQVAALPFLPKHRDPFDRILTVQSRDRNVPIISSDSIFDAYGVIRVWGLKRAEKRFPVQTQKLDPPYRITPPPPPQTPPCTAA